MRTMQAKITSKGQVTIPVEVRRHLGIAATDTIVFVINGEGAVELRPARYTLRSIRGAVSALPGREAGDFEEQIEEAMEEMAERVVQRMGGR